MMIKNSKMEIPQGKIVVYYIPDRRSRNIIHQYLEENYPYFSKTSLCCEFFEYDFLKYKQCEDCGHKYVPLNNYHFGSEQNNIDEWKSGICPQCGETVWYEPNYDDRDDIFVVRKNNIIAIGEYFREYTNRPRERVTYDIITVNSIINSSKKYIIDSPSKPMKKEKIGHFVEEMIRNIK